MADLHSQPVGQLTVSQLRDEEPTSDSPAGPEGRHPASARNPHLAWGPICTFDCAHTNQPLPSAGAPGGRPLLHLQSGPGNDGLACRLPLAACVISIWPPRTRNAGTNWAIMSRLPVEIAQLSLISAKTMDCLSEAQICFLSNEARTKLGPAST